MTNFKVTGNGVEVNLNTADIELLLECLNERKDNLQYEGLDKDELFDREDKIVQLAESLIDLIGE